MGNSATKEQRPPPPYPRPHGSREPSSSQASPTSPHGPYSPDGPHVIYNSRHGRSSRSELSTLLGISTGHSERELHLEARRETKAEREAKKLERERINREKERERSMREESVDGGYLVTQGVYTGIEDYNKSIVRQLMIERRIAPFWRGLNDHSSSWTEHQLVAVGRGLPIPAADDIPENSPGFPPNEEAERNSEQNINSLTVPIAGRTLSYNSDSSTNLLPSPQNFSLPNSLSPNSGSALLRGRAKTLASLTTSSRNVPQSELQPRETQLPKEQYINGQPIEAYLYKDASECPICFLYYPPYLNRTRCCDQSICSECFVQIKRPDPHPPEHHGDSSESPPPPPEDPTSEVDGAFVSEPASCPFCVQPEFGVSYEPPPFRRGLTYANPASLGGLGRTTTAMSSSSSLASSPPSGQPSPGLVQRKRNASLSVNAPQVITTDKIRPDWATKLASARANAARRSAAATALHTAAYLMGGRGASDGRAFPGFGRRVMMRRGNGGDSPSSGNSSSHLNMLAVMTERYGDSERSEPADGNQAVASGEPSPSIAGPRSGSRRNRVDDLEEMMMMEAIRLSLASEEDRLKKEEKVAKKEAKKKTKEEKKAEKAARKHGVYNSSANQSSGTLGSPSSTSLSIDFDNSKGKGVVREGGPHSGSDTSLSRPAPQTSQSESAQSHLEKSRAQLLPIDPASTSTYRPSHLRNLSNVSSSTSSIAEGAMDEGTHSSLEASPSSSGVMIARAEAQDGAADGTPPGGGAGIEPMFNFRSLAAMIDQDEKSSTGGSADHAENPTRAEAGSSRETADSPGHVTTHLSGSSTTANDKSLESKLATTKPEAHEASPQLEEVSAGLNGLSNKAHEAVTVGEGVRVEIGSI